MAAKREKEAELYTELSKLQDDLYHQSSNWSFGDNASLTEASQLCRRATALATTVKAHKCLSSDMNNFQQQLQDCLLCRPLTHNSCFSFSPPPNCAAGRCGCDVPEGSVVGAHWLRQGGAARGPCSCSARGVSL